MDNFHVERNHDRYTISIQGFKRVDLHGIDLNERIFFSEAIYEGKNFLERACLENNIFMYGQSCGKLYNKELADEYNLRFPVDIKHSEDHVFYLQNLLYIRRIYTYPGTKYCYQLDLGKETLTHRQLSYNEALNRFYKLESICSKVVTCLNITNTDVLHQIYYFSVTGGLSLVLQSIYISNLSIQERRSALKLMKHDLHKLKNKFCPNRLKGKILKFLLLNMPLSINDWLLLRSFV